MEEVTTIFKKYREKEMLTMQELADALASGSGEIVSVPSVQQWESGKHIPQKYIWVKLALNTTDWRRDMALDVLAVLDPSFHSQICDMLQGAAA